MTRVLRMDTRTDRYVIILSYQAFIIKKNISYVVVNFFTPVR